MKPSNLLLLKANLSLGDFLLSLTQCPTLMFFLFGMPVLAKVLLPLTFFCAGLCLTVSVTSIAAMAVYTYLQLKGSCDGARAFVPVVILITWILGVSVGALFAAFTAVNTDTPIERFPKKGTNQEVVTYSLVSLLLVALTSVYGAYLSTVKLLYSAPALKPRSAHDSEVTRLAGDNCNFAHKRKGIMSCVAIICVHTVCWLPFITAQALDQSINNESVSLNLKVIAWMLVLCQSALNPCIYRVPKDSSRAGETLYCQPCLLSPQRKAQSQELPAPTAHNVTGRVFHIRLPDNPLRVGATAAETYQPITHHSYTAA